MSNEAKVGLLLVLALAVLGWLTVASGTLSFKGSTPERELHAVFTDVNGIKPGTPVRMAGVTIGDVTRIVLQPNGTATLYFDVRRNVPLPADVAAQVTASGLIGEYYLALVPGPQTVRGDGGLLASTATRIPALSSADPANVGTDFAAMAADMKDITRALKAVLGDAENTARFQTIVANLATFSQSLGGADPDTFKNLNLAAQNLAAITEDVRAGKGALGQLVSSNTSNTQLDATLNQLNAAVTDLRAILGKINNGQGSLGQLVNSDRTADNLNTALTTFNTLTSPFTPGTTEAETPTHPGLHSQLLLESAYLTAEDGVTLSEAQLRIQPGTRTFLQLGAHYDGFAARADSSGNPYSGQNFGNTTKLSAQVGRSFPLGANLLNLRAGVHRNTPGVGADFLTPGITYIANLSDPAATQTPGADAPHLSLSARAHFTDTLYGTIGYDNILNSNYASPMVGLGVRFGGKTTQVQSIPISATGL